MASTPVSNQPAETEDYYDKVHRASWAYRTASFIGCAMVGVAFGAVAGAIAAFLPCIMGALGIAGAAAVAMPGLAAVAGSAALFAGVGGLMGFAAGGVVGASSGAVAAGLAEKEKREHQKDGHSVSRQAPPVRPPEIKNAGIPKLFSWKVALFTVPLVAGFGALLALNPATAPGVAMLGFQGATAATATVAAQPASAAAIAASASMFGMLGAAFAFKFSYLTNVATNFSMKMISGKLLSAEPEKMAAIQPQEDIVKTNEAPISEPARETRSFASDRIKFSLQTILDKSEESNPQLIQR
jgi:hypothetical protein